MKSLLFSATLAVVAVPASAFEICPQGYAEADPTYKQLYSIQASIAPDTLGNCELIDSGRVWFPDDSYLFKSWDCNRGFSLTSQHAGSDGFPESFLLSSSSGSSMIYRRNQSAGEIPEKIRRWKEVSRNVKLPYNYQRNNYLAYTLKGWAVADDSDPAAFPLQVRFVMQASQNCVEKNDNYIRF